MHAAVCHTVSALLALGKKCIVETYRRQPSFIRLGSPAHSASELSLPCRRVWRRVIHFFLLQIRFWREPITELAFHPGALLAGLTHWWQESDGKQPIAYRVIWTRPVGHASCAEENDNSFPRPSSFYVWPWSGKSQTTHSCDLDYN